MHHSLPRALRKSIAAAALLLPLLAKGQAGLTISATGTAVVTTFGTSNRVIDNAVTITGSTSITQASVSISSGFQSGDVLSYDAGSLPSGVTGSFSSVTGILTFAGSATPANYQTLLRTVNISLSSASASTRTATFTLGNLGSYTNGHYYKFVSGAVSWTAAKAAAAAVGNQYYGLTGYLATITSSGENTFIKQTLAADGWIGASDNYSEINTATGATTYANQTAAEGKWYWVTGPEAGTNFSNGNTTPVLVSGKYMYWNSSEPNNSGGSEDYGEIYSGGSTPGGWNDLPTSSTLGYVVEYGGMAGDPTVQLSASRTINVKATSIEGTYVYNVTAYRTKATPVVVDGSLTIAAMSSITNARVTVATNFNVGDTLGYTGALPSGVTAAYNGPTGVLSFTGTATAAQFQALLRTVTFKTSVMPNVNREVTFSLGSQVAYSNGHFYQYITSAGISWSSAKTAAAGQTYLGLTGYLATITTSSENAFITQKLASDGWIGASDGYSEINTATGTTTYVDQTAAEGKWYWVTGPEAGTNFSTGNGTPTAVSSRYMNWNSGEPNNSSANENYAQIFATSSVGKWNDLSGSSQGGYVVEFGGLASDPVVSLSSTSLITISTPLPVAGIALEALPVKGQVALDWKSLNEQNVAYYAVERSEDARAFGSIGTVTAFGSGNHTYHFVDALPLDGAAYYRVKSVDDNGERFYSSVKQVRMEQTGNAPSGVATNPAWPYVEVSLAGGEPATFRCVDATGRTVLNGSLQGGKNRINIGDLKPGTYYLSVDDGGQTTVTPFTRI